MKKQLAIMAVLSTFAATVTIGSISTASRAEAAPAASTRSVDDCNNRNITITENNVNVAYSGTCASVFIEGDNVRVALVNVGSLDIVGARSRVTVSGEVSQYAYIAGVSNSLRAAAIPELWVEAHSARVLAGRIDSLSVWGDRNRITWSDGAPSGFVVGAHNRLRGPAGIENCDGRHIVIAEDNTKATFSGDCASVTITANSAMISLDSTRSLDVSGTDVHVNVANDADTMVVQKEGNVFASIKHVEELAIHGNDSFVGTTIVDAIVVTGNENSAYWTEGQPTISDSGVGNSLYRADSGS